ncbi:MAG: glycosyltransferase family 39 protein [Anaerolineae bacterium]|nr:glycosyltransferase family 39 protein [Anaerolineae bacterium]
MILLPVTLLLYNLKSAVTFTVSMFQRHRFDILFVLLVILACLLNVFFKIGDVPPAAYPWSDESDVASDAVLSYRHGLEFHYPAQLAGGPIAVWLETGWIYLFGPGLTGLRILNGLVNLVSVLLLYLLVRQLPLPPGPGWVFRGPTFNQWLALTSALFMANSTWILGLARIATPNWSLVPPLTTLTFYFLWRALNTNRRRDFVATGVMMGFLFYGYIPGYCVPGVPVIFLGMLWLSRKRQAQLAFPPSGLYLWPFPVALLVATPIFVYFGLHPDAVLQRVLQLVHTNELSLANLFTQNLLDTLSAFGFWPNWLLQGRFEYVAFDPLVTVLFIVGLIVTLRRWRNNAYLFLLIWWLVMIAPAFFSRSASTGFIFEVWRRGIGAQPVSFVFVALTVLAAAQWLQKLVRRPLLDQAILPVVVALIVIAAGLSSYWLYFGRWANSGVVPMFFPAGPVRLVDWMEAQSRADTLFVFPIRPKVSPTTRPEVFTVRYLYDGPGTNIFPVLDEATVSQKMVTAFFQKPATVHLMLHNRIVVDPKGYFDYVLGTQGEVVARDHQPDYQVTTYRFRPDASFDPSLEPIDVVFGDTLRLIGQRFQPNPLATGQTLGVALRWAMSRPEQADYNVSLALYDDQGYEWARADKPLLSEEKYLTTRHWMPGTTSTVYPTLAVPADAPPGLYALRAVVYNAETGVRLPPVGGQTDLSISLAEVQGLPNPSAVEVTALNMAQPLAGQFPGGLRLLGTASSTGPTVQPGNQAWMSLWWQAAEPMTQEVGLVLALAMSDGEPMPLFDTPQPLLADYPTTAWSVGQVYRANYPALIPATATTGDYLLVIRLFDLESLELLGEQLLFPVSIQARTHIFEAPLLAQQTDVEFGELIRLRGFELEDVVPGETTRVKVQWQALREMSESYKTFLHLTDARGRIVAQVDTLPRQGLAPTTGWLAGEIIEDELALDIPANIPVDPYQWVIGWYNEKTGQRLMTAEGGMVLLVDGLAIP